jgi:hypothetical protein
MAALPFHHQILGWWPMLVAICSGIMATAIVIRYKLPELTKKVEAMTKENAKRPSKKDLEITLDSFHSICKFNQVSCQKELDLKMIKIKQDVEEKLGELWELINQQAILMARVDERVAIMHNNGGKRLGDCNNGQHCLFIPPKPMVDLHDK